MRGIKMTTAKKATSKKSTSVEKLNIYQRIHAVMQDVSYVQKDKKNGMQYSTVSHDKVTAKVRPIMVKHGVVYHPVNLEHRQDGNRTEVALTVRFVNIDKPEEYVDVPGLGYGVDNQDKGPGKAISYAVKYCLLKALGLETGDDADNEAIEHEPKTEIPRGVVQAVIEQSLEACEKADAHALHEVWSEFGADEKVVLWGKFNSQQRATMKELLKEVQ